MARQDGLCVVPLKLVDHVYLPPPQRSPLLHVVHPELQPVVHLVEDVDAVVRRPRLGLSRRGRRRLLVLLLPEPVVEWRRRLRRLEGRPHLEDALRRLGKRIVLHREAVGIVGVAAMPSLPPYGVKDPHLLLHDLVPVAGVAEEGVEPGGVARGVGDVAHVGGGVVLQLDLEGGC